MAHPDRPISGATPDPFVSMMRGMFTEGELTQMNGVGREMGESGFRGPMAARIAAWQGEGFGRELGVPLILNHGIPDLQTHRSTMFALRLPMPSTGRTPFDQRVLVLFPTEESCDAAIIGPLPQSFSPLAEMVAAINESKLSDFESLYGSSKKPYIDAAWVPQPGLNQFEAFCGNPSLYRATLVETITLGERQEAKIKEAVDYERKLQRLAGVNSLAADATLLDTRFGEDVFGDLWDISKLDDLGGDNPH